MPTSWKDALTYDEDYDWWQGWLSLPKLASLRMPEDERRSQALVDADEGDGREDEDGDGDDDDADLAKELEAMEKITGGMLSMLTDPKKMADFVRQANPGVGLDAKMPGYDQSMREIFEKSASDTAKILRGEEVPEYAEHDRKVEAALRERDRREAAGQFEITILGEPDEEPSPAQVAAVEYILANEDHVLEVILKAASDVAKEIGNANREGLSGRELREFNKAIPPNATPEQMRKRLTFGGMTVTREDRDDVAYVEYGLGCAWDPEHGLLVVLHRDRVVYVGGQGDGWEDEI